MKRNYREPAMAGKVDKTPNSLSSTLFNRWIFFVVVFCWTWAFWILAAVLRISVQTTLGEILLVLGLMGPTLGGIGFAYLTQDKEYWREYWLRIFDPNRIGARWYLVIVLFVPALLATAVLLDVASAGNDVLLQISKKVASFLSAPTTIAPFLFLTFIQGPLPEELGWRGYALDQLQIRRNALVSSLILGAIWALWHLPLFFIKDLYYFDHGIWSLEFWMFMVGGIPTSVIYTWIFNNTHHSTLGAILFHFMSNFTYELGNLTNGTTIYSTAMWVVAAIVVVALWGAGTLAGNTVRSG
jgi:CAAX protease family protein